MTRQSSNQNSQLAGIFRDTKGVCKQMRKTIECTVDKQLKDKSKRKERSTIEVPKWQQIKNPKTTKFPNQEEETEKSCMGGNSLIYEIS